MKMTLRELCAEVGVSRRAVQGYEKLGLVAPSEKNKYGHLLYDEKAVARVRLIHFYQETGLSLQEIRRLIDAPSAAKKTALNAQLKKMEAKRTRHNAMIELLRQHIRKL